MSDAYIGEFVDAILPIPINAIHIKMNVKTMDEHGDIHNLEGSFSPDNIREAIRIFEEWEVGSYPRYELTEIGRELASQ